MSKLVVIGGSKGLGLSLLQKLKQRFDETILFDVCEPLDNENLLFFKKCDLSKDFNVCLEDIKTADWLIITAGIGIVRPFEKTTLAEIKKLLKVNLESTISLIKAFYANLLSGEEKRCFVMSSIAGEVSSPLFSVYSSSKAGLTKFCEAINIELEMAGSANRVTCGCATSFVGSSFNGGTTNLSLLDEVADKCIDAIENRTTYFYINEELCLDVIKRYSNDKHEFGISSYNYKIKNNRIDNERKLITVGYLSGTFDLFHVGHLNLLRRAKEQCDYLIVAVHDSGAWKGKETFIPYEERRAIVESIKYVDQVVEDYAEDSDAWDVYHYDKLFVGSDYKGTERFNRYEQILKGKAEIVYFPYTKGTSSTQLRDALKKK